MLEHCPAEVGGLVRRLQDEVHELDDRLAAAHPETRVGRARLPLAAAAPTGPETWAEGA